MSSDALDAKLARIDLFLNTGAFTPAAAATAATTAISASGAASAAGAVVGTKGAAATVSTPVRSGVEDTDDAASALRFIGAAAITAALPVSVTVLTTGRPTQAAAAPVTTVKALPDGFLSDPAAAFDSPVAAVAIATQSLIQDWRSWVSPAGSTLSIAVASPLQIEPLPQPVATELIHQSFSPLDTASFDSLLAAVAATNSLYTNYYYGSILPTTREASASLVEKRLRSLFPPSHGQLVDPAMCLQREICSVKDMYEQRMCLHEKYGAALQAFVCDFRTAADRELKRREGEHDEQPDGST